MDPSQDAKILEFCSITDATAEHASFFLESTNWDLSSALSNFFDDPRVQDAEGDIIGQQQQSIPQVAVEEHRPDLDEDEIQSGLRTVPRAAHGDSHVAETEKRKVRAPVKDKSRVKTLSDLRREPVASNDDSDDEDDEERNEYYTGGQKSGMMVQDPKKSDRKSKIGVDDIFEKARKMGARDGQSNDLNSPLEASRKAPAFTGRARTLNDDGSTLDSVSTPSPLPEPSIPPPGRHVITFWRNGFTVNAGPLRSMTDPANANFLASIHRGEAPRELAPSNPLTSMEVSLVRKDEDWKPPPEPKYRPFSGTGHTLDVPSGSDSREPVSIGEAPQVWNPRPVFGFIVDDSKPTTMIQIRLRDGTRLVSKFNHSHTVGDIRAFIDMSRPGGGGDYSLQMVGFPPKQLRDDSKTVEEEGLLNSVVLQR